MNKEEFKWITLLFMSLLLFVLGMMTGYIIFTLVSMVLTVIIYKNGDDILFKEYNEKKKEKREKQKIIKEASQVVIRERLIKKNKGGDNKCQMEE